MTLLQSLPQWSPRGPGGEEALTNAARRGSRRAFDALALAHEARLRGFLARQVGTQAAEDVLQETWIAAWGGLSGFNGRAGFKAWLYGIALHKCHDHQRRRAQDARGAATLREDVRYEPPAWDAQLALRETVRGVLARLPEAQREVLELYYYAELTLPEVAAALGRNLNTVKYQFYRGHALAARSMDGAGDESEK